MISIGILAKVLFKPSEAYGELKDEVTWEDGLIFFFIVSLVSLLVFGVFSRFLGINLMIIPFGFGAVLAVGTVLLFFGIELLDLIISSYIANWIAIKLGGSGNYHETFSFFCYGQSLNLVKAIASIIALIWFQAKMFATIRALNQGMVTETSAVSELAGFVPYLFLFFMLWLFWIRASAVSAGHSISKLRGFGATVISYSVVIILISALLIAFK